MVAWDKQRVETYASQILNSILIHPAAAEELVALGVDKKDKDRSTKVCEWAERWSDIAFDIAEVFAAEADQRDADPANRLFEDD